MARPGSTVIRSFSAAAARPSVPSAPVPPILTTRQPTAELHRHHVVSAPQVDAQAFRQG